MSKEMTLRQMMEVYKALVSRANLRGKSSGETRKRFMDKIFEVFQNYAIQYTQVGEKEIIEDDFLPTFIDEVITYFEGTEEYEKCDYLVKYKQKFVTPHLEKI
jgi:hypothetical protein